MNVSDISQKKNFYREKIKAQNISFGELLDFFSFCEQMSNSSSGFFEEFEDINLLIIFNIQQSHLPETLMVFELCGGKLKFKYVDQEFEKFLLESRENCSKVEIQISSENLISSFHGQMDPWRAIMNGEIKLSGDIQNLLIFEKLFSIFYGFLDL